MKRYGECVSCGECCKVLHMRGMLSDIVSQHGSLDEAKKYYSFRGVRIPEINEKLDAVMFEMDIPCDKLDEHNHCKLHDDPAQKPVICHRYPLGPDDRKLVAGLEELLDAVGGQAELLEHLGGGLVGDAAVAAELAEQLARHDPVETVGGIRGIAHGLDPALDRGRSQSGQRRRERP